MDKRMTRTQAARLLALGADKPVRIHSYQSAMALHRLEEDNVLYGDAETAMYPSQYSWMQAEMKARIPGHTGRLPVWGWLRRPDSRLKALDAMTDLVRITAIVPRARMLISDVDMWSAVVNDGPVHFDEDDEAVFDAAWPDRPQQGSASRAAYDNAVRGTWHKVLDPLGPRDHHWWGDRSSFILQACIDGIRRDEIVSIRRYGDTRRPSGRRSMCANAEAGADT